MSDDSGKHGPENPVASVVVPVFNAERWLPESLQDLLGQTLDDIEIIFVDDGSTDGSPAILEAAAARDRRVRVLRQERRFAGMARNLGLEAARGKWLIALDADDRFSPKLLESAVRRGEETRADIVLFNADRIVMPMAERVPDKGLAIAGRLPAEVFQAGPETADAFVVLAPWNKLYRRDFVLSGGFRWSGTFESNDIMFSFLTLASASRIAALPKTLVHYRVGNRESVQGRKDESPEDGARMFSDLWAELERRGLAGRFKGIYATAAVRFLLGRRFATFARRESAEDLWRLLKSGECAAIGLDSMRAEDICGPNADTLRRWLRDFQKMDCDGWLWSLVRRYRERGDRYRWTAGAAASREKRARKEADAAADDAVRARRELAVERRKAAKSAMALETLRGSFSCRLGFALTWLPRKLFH